MYGLPFTGAKREITKKNKRVKMADGDADEEMTVSVITALKWIPRSYLLETPIPYELSPEEREELANANAGNVAAPKEALEDGEDAEDDEEDDDGMPLSQLRDMELNEERMEEDAEDADDLGSDADDQRYNTNDKVLVTATVQDEQASLEIHVYDVENGSFYIHHDIALPAYPLCLEWLGVRGKELNWTQTESQSFVAIGSFEPHIEIWSLDVLDALEPNAKLEGHEDAVLCLAWNAAHPNLLASGGGDNSVKLWDLQKSVCGRSFDDLHTDKVQSCAWNPAEPTVLLTGSFDRTVGVFDARDPTKAAKYSVVKADVECVVWDPHNPAIFGVSSEDGVVTFVDVRRGPGAPPLLCFQAHAKACSVLTPNTRVPGLYATCSADKTVKIWDVQSDLEAASAVPVSESTTGKKKSSKHKSTAVEKEPVATRKMKVGKLFACQFACNAEDASKEGDDALLLATGGDKGSVALWHAGGVEEDEEDARIRETFSDRVLDQPRAWTTRSSA
jgi:periodic tryptophan protein 1